MHIVSLPLIVVIFVVSSSRHEISLVLHGFVVWHVHIALVVVSSLIIVWGKRHRVEIVACEIGFSWLWHCPASILDRHLLRILRVL